jgi:hypothetical protein
MSNDKEFSVCIFYPDDTYEYVHRWITAEEAVKAAKSYTERPAALIGIIKRVIITDGDDFTNFEWIFGKGVTYPKREDLHDTTKTS